ncbi:MAG: hypothetical protein Q8S54_04500 [Bacteroidota bacterium]|nr:hypothetical protein [Bacteroidota bacterium]
MDNSLSKRNTPDNISPKAIQTNESLVKNEDLQLDEKLIESEIRMLSASLKIHRLKQPYYGHS